jgi:hypothetical protein
MKACHSTASDPGENTITSKKQAPTAGVGSYPLTGSPASMMLHSYIRPYFSWNVIDCSEKGSHPRVDRAGITDLAQSS